MKWCWKHDILFLLYLWENEIFSSTVDFLKTKIMQNTSSASLCHYGIMCLLFTDLCQKHPGTCWKKNKWTETFLHFMVTPHQGGNITKPSPGVSCRSSGIMIHPTQMADGPSHDLGTGILLVDLTQSLHHSCAAKEHLALHMSSLKGIKE